MTAAPPGDGYYAPGSCPICHAAPASPHEDFCPVPAQKWEAEHDAEQAAVRDAKEEWR